MSVKLNGTFRLPVEGLEDSTGGRISRSADYKFVVPARSVVKVHDVSLFGARDLERLVRRIPLRGSEGDIFPYKESEINVYGLEPRGMHIGQTFILKDKVTRLLEGFTSIFGEFYNCGLSRMPPCRIYGEDAEGVGVMAFYLPPITEVHGDRTVLLDGVHRSYVCLGVNSPVNSLNIRGASVPLPFDPITWSEATLVDVKPEINQRYRSLKPALFRDLGSIGVEG